MTFKNINVVLSATDTTLTAVLTNGARKVSSFGKAVELADGGLSKFALAARGASAVGVAIGVALTYATAQAMRFDTQMRNVQSITKQTDASLAATSESVIQLSRNLPQSAATLAEGLYNIASSGFQGADGLKVLEASATAASAGLSNTETSAKAITAVLNAYGMKASDAADVSDVLFQTVNLGVVTFDELAGSIGDVVGLASQAGVSIAEVGSAIATMTLTGISGAESTTALNRLIQSLIQPSDELKQKMDELGISLEDLKDPAVGLHGVMEKLRVASGGNVETLLKWFPEIRAAKGALSLMANEGQNANRVFGEITDKQKRAGATAAALREQMKSLSAQIALFRNWVNAGAIELGTHLLPVVILVLKEIKSLAHDAAPSLAAAWQRLVPLFKVMGEIGVDLVSILGVMIDTVDDLVKVLGAVGFAAVVAGLTAMFTVLKKLTGIFANNKAAVQALAIILGGLLLEALVTSAVAAIAGGAALDALAIGAYGAVGAIEGLVASLATATGGLAILAVAVGISAVNAFQNAEAAGRKMGESIRSSIKPGDIASIRAGFAQMTSEIEKQNAVLAQQKGLWGAIRGAVDLLPIVDLGDTVVDASGKLKGLGPQAAQVADQLITLRNVVTDLQLRFKRFGGGEFLGAGEDPFKAIARSTKDAETGMRVVAMWVDKLNLNPLTMSVKDMASAINTAMTQAEIGSPAVDALAAAARTLGDDTADATEKLDAFKKTLDAIIGVHISAFEAVTQFGQSLQGVVTAATEGGTSLSQFTQQGQANRSALASAAKAALDHAAAVSQDVAATEGVEAGLRAGNQALYENVGALMDVMKQAGYTDAQVAELIQTMGLTPRNLATIVELKGADGAKLSLQDIRRLEDQVGAGAHGSVTLDTSQAMAAMKQLIQQGNAWKLWSIDPANRASTGGLQIGPDGKPFFAGSAPTVSLPPIPRGGAPRISPASSGGGGGKAALDRENEAIAKNREQWQLDHESIDERIKDLDRLIAAEKPFTDRWVQLQQQREQAAKDQQKAVSDYLEAVYQEQQAVAKYLDALFKQRVEIAKNEFEYNRISLQDYLALLDEEIAGVQAYTDEWVSLEQERERAIQKEAEAQRRAAEAQREVAEQLADVYSSAMQAFKDQQDEYDKVLKQRNQRFLEEMENLAESVSGPVKKMGDIIGTFGQANRTVGRDEIVAMLNHRVEAVKRWKTALQSLLSRGYDQDFVENLAKAGPEALNLAETLETMDPSVVGDAFKQFQSVGDELADIYKTRDAAAIQSKINAELPLPAMRSFNELLEEEVNRQLEAKQLRNEALEWANSMIGAYGSLSDAMREYISLLQQEAQAKQQKDSQQQQQKYPYQSKPTGDPLHDEAIKDPAVSSFLEALYLSGKSYDSGGYLPTGWSMAYNGTGRPEPVGHGLRGGFSPSLTAYVSLTVGSGVDAATTRQAVNDGVSDAFRSVVRLLDQGVKK